jgi:asparagine synthetase B (glutamine-hydrolysing)
MGGSRLGDISLGGSLLQLRGAKRSASPLVDGEGNVLCFNGEIFSGLEGLCLGENDSKALSRALAAAGRTGSAEDAIAHVLSRLRGPWALVYWHESAQRLWYGRDVVGRRSLIVHHPNAADPTFVLSSLSPLPLEVEVGDRRYTAQNEPHFWDEVAAGIYTLDATNDDGTRMKVVGMGDELGEELTTRWQFRKHEWKHCVPSTLEEFQRASKLVHSTQQPPLPLVSQNIKADLNNVCIDASTEVAVDGLLAALDASVERRVTHSIDPSPGLENSTNSSTTEVGPAAELGVLFSGGVDSMVIAALADRHCPPEQPIDLLTVCFDGGCSPDRAAAIDGVAELRIACPDRVWRLIFVDAKLTDVDNITPHLTAALHPSDTIMDLNIGAAIWLAARGEGWIEIGDRKGVTAGTESDDTQRMNYRSKARVLLLGQGADEQCAGYGRHRTVFRKAEEESIGGGWAALSAEMRLDVRRLWVRNLGRDDRLVADHGREARFPYLDEGVMMRLLNTPLSAIADLRKPQGDGDKVLIRGVAERLGLPRAARRIKRAIQFGTRIARESNRREFGSGRRANASSAGQVKFKFTRDGGQTGETRG